MDSVLSNLLIEFLWSFEGGVDHLAEDWFLFFEICQLVLEVVVLLLLVQHPHLQLPVQSLNQWHRGIGDLIVGVEYFGLKRLKVLSEEFDKFVVLLEVFVGLARQVLD